MWLIYGTDNFYYYYYSDSKYDYSALILFFFTELSREDKILGCFGWKWTFLEVIVCVCVFFTVFLAQHCSLRVTLNESIMNRLQPERWMLCCDWLNIHLIKLWWSGWAKIKHTYTLKSFYLMVNLIKDSISTIQNKFSEKCLLSHDPNDRRFDRQTVIYIYIILIHDSNKITSSHFVCPPCSSSPLSLLPLLTLKSPPKNSHLYLAFADVASNGMIITATNCPR